MERAQLASCERLPIYSGRTTILRDIILHLISQNLPCLAEGKWGNQFCFAFTISIVETDERFGNGVQISQPTVSAIDSNIM